MDKITKVLEFNKRFNIKELPDENERFLEFKTRVDNIIKTISFSEYSTSVIINLSVTNILGVKINRYNESPLLNLIGIFLNEFDQIKYFQIINALIISLQENNNDKFGWFVKHFIESLKMSNINLRIEYNKDQNYILLLPKGQTELDEKLVDEPYSFLDINSRPHFIEAINYYQKSTLTDRIKAAEQLRRALEEFLKHKLKNTKGLDGNITELQRVLKGDQRDPQVRRTIYAILNYLDTYFNENSKHNDGDISETECEFLIYQTGVLLRYIDKSIIN